MPDEQPPFPPLTMSLLSRVLGERRRHEALGSDAAYEDGLTQAELTQAAICYAETAHAQVCQPTPAPPGFKHRDWPFAMADFHAESDVTENLIRAAGYLIAEAERLTRLSGETPTPPKAQAAVPPAPPPTRTRTHPAPYVKIAPGTDELAPLIHIYLPHRDDLRPAG